MSLETAPCPRGLLQRVVRRDISLMLLAVCRRHSLGNFPRQFLSQLGWECMGQVGSLTELLDRLE